MMKERTGVIYKHTNMIDKKSYIGQTINNPKYRWNHGEGYKDSPLFYSAIKKYGWDNFEHIILEQDIPQNQLNEREEYWINFYHSDLREYGYNLTSGGNHPLSELQLQERVKKFKQWQQEHPDIARKSIDSMQQYWTDHPEEKKLVLKRACEASSKYWKEHPEEHYKRMKKMQDNAKESNIKPVKCIETNMVYESAREACRQTGISYSGIGKTCNKKQKTAGGFHWCFIDKEEYKQLCKL